ncbi:hypothetical protein PPEP_a1609 [Pseudoalteromonas peptidolytica F12-50-A1]|uniref:Uncharacterized protein n=1 Tax=Pseudoalteromonas peptidolytica F12-50-A1 TaxID=1315280 RepID=A0A8I0MXK4_9GAMM|nr:hypothetical protein [Pseudoalteromonas peptidolytica F12-50-A1]
MFVPIDITFEKAKLSQSFLRPPLLGEREKHDLSDAKIHSISTAKATSHSTLLHN